jgi:hypothetical protein
MKFNDQIINLDIEIVPMKEGDIIIILLHNTSPPPPFPSHPDQPIPKYNLLQGHQCLLDLEFDFSFTITVPLV